MPEIKKILMVDDDENLLNSFRRGLRNRFDFITSNNPKAALELIESGEKLAVIISDFKMPDMDGNKFLSIVRDITPDTSRILLTGFADINVAVDAINNGNIFRFLTKPVSINQVIRSIEDALEQFRLKTVEKDLLHNTLMGALKVLVELLTMQNENIAKQSTFYRTLAKKIANRLGEQNTWSLEIAAILSQIGYLAIPNDIINRKLLGLYLNKEESQMFNQHPKIGRDLLNKIPRLEQVAEAVGNQFENYKKSVTPLADSILQVLAEFNLLTANNKTYAEAIDAIANAHSRFNPAVVEALEIEITKLEGGVLVRSYTLTQLPIGSILVQDLFDANGILLLPKGMEVSEIMLYKLINYNKVTKVIQPIKVSEKSPLIK